MDLSSDNMSSDVSTNTPSANMDNRDVESIHASGEKSYGKEQSLHSYQATEGSASTLSRLSEPSSRNNSNKLEDSPIGSESQSTTAKREDFPPALAPIASPSDSASSGIASRLNVPTLAAATVPSASSENVNPPSIPSNSSVPLPLARIIAPDKEVQSSEPSPPQSPRAYPQSQPLESATSAGVVKKDEDVQLAKPNKPIPVTHPRYPPKLDLSIALFPTTTSSTPLPALSHSPSDLQPSSRTASPSPDTATVSRQKQSSPITDKSEEASTEPEMSPASEESQPSKNTSETVAGKKHGTDEKSESVKLVDKEVDKPAEKKVDMEAEKETEKDVLESAQNLGIIGEAVRISSGTGSGNTGFVVGVQGTKFLIRLTVSKGSLRNYPTAIYDSSGHAFASASNSSDVEIELPKDRSEFRRISAAAALHAALRGSDRDGTFSTPAARTRRASTSRVRDRKDSLSGAASASASNESTVEGSVEVHPAKAYGSGKKDAPGQKSTLQAQSASSVGAERPTKKESPPKSKGSRETSQASDLTLEKERLSSKTLTVHSAPSSISHTKPTTITATAASESTEPAFASVVTVGHTSSPLVSSADLSAVPAVTEETQSDAVSESDASSVTSEKKRAKRGRKAASSPSTRAPRELAKLFDAFALNPALSDSDSDVGASGSELVSDEDSGTDGSIMGRDVTDGRKKSSLNREDSKFAKKKEKTPKPETMLSSSGADTSAPAAATKSSRKRSNISFGSYDTSSSVLPAEIAVVMAELNAITGLSEEEKAAAFAAEMLAYRGKRTRSSAIPAVSSVHSASSVSSTPVSVRSGSNKAREASAATGSARKNKPGPRSKAGTPIGSPVSTPLSTPANSARASAGSPPPLPTSTPGKAAGPTPGSFAASSSTAKAKKKRPAAADSERDAATGPLSKRIEYSTEAAGATSGTWRPKTSGDDSGTDEGKDKETDSVAMKLDESDATVSAVVSNGSSLETKRGSKVDLEGSADDSTSIASVPKSSPLGRKASTAKGPKDHAKRQVLAGQDSDVDLEADTDSVAGRVDSESESIAEVESVRSVRKLEDEPSISTGKVHPEGPRSKKKLKQTAPSRGAAGKKSRKLQESADEAEEEERGAVRQFQPKGRGRKAPKEPESDQEESGRTFGETGREQRGGARRLDEDLHAEEHEDDDQNSTATRDTEESRISDVMEASRQGPRRRKERETPADRPSRQSLAAMRAQFDEAYPLSRPETPDDVALKHSALDSSDAESEVSADSYSQRTPSSRGGAGRGGAGHHACKYTASGAQRPPASVAAALAASVASSGHMNYTSALMSHRFSAGGNFLGPAAALAASVARERERERVDRGEVDEKENGGRRMREPKSIRNSRSMAEDVSERAVKEEYTVATGALSASSTTIAPSTAKPARKPRDPNFIPITTRTEMYIKRMQDKFADANDMHRRHNAFSKYYHKLDDPPRGDPWCEVSRKRGWWNDMDPAFLDNLRGIRSVLVETVEKKFQGGSSSQGIQERYMRKNVTGRTPRASTESPKPGKGQDTSQVRIRYYKLGTQRLRRLEMLALGYSEYLSSSESDSESEVESPWGDNSPSDRLRGYDSDESIDFFSEFEWITKPGNIGCTDPSLANSAASTTVPSEADMATTTKAANGTRAAGVSTTTLPPMDLSPSSDKVVKCFPNSQDPYSLRSWRDPSVYRPGVTVPLEELRPARLEKVVQSLKKSVVDDMEVSQLFALREKQKERGYATDTSRDSDDSGALHPVLQKERKFGDASTASTAVESSDGTKTPSPPEDSAPVIDLDDLVTSSRYRARRLLRYRKKNRIVSRWYKNTNAEVPIFCYNSTIYNTNSKYSSFPALEKPLPFPPPHPDFVYRRLRKKRRIGPRLPALGYVPGTATKSFDGTGYPGYPIQGTFRDDGTDPLAPLADNILSAPTSARSAPDDSDTGSTPVVRGPEHMAVDAYKSIIDEFDPERPAHLRPFIPTASSISNFVPDPRVFYGSNRKEIRERMPYYHSEDFDNAGPIHKSIARGSRQKPVFYGQWSLAAYANKEGHESIWVQDASALPYVLEKDEELSDELGHISNVMKIDEVGNENNLPGDISLTIKDFGMAGAGSGNTSPAETKDLASSSPSSTPGTPSVPPLHPESLGSQVQDPSEVSSAHNTSNSNSISSPPPHAHARSPNGVPAADFGNLSLDALPDDLKEAPEHMYMEGKQHKYRLPPLFEKQRDILRLLYTSRPMPDANTLYAYARCLHCGVTKESLQDSCWNEACVLCPVHPDNLTAPKQKEWDEKYLITDAYELQQSIALLHELEELFEYWRRKKVEWLNSVENPLEEKDPIDLVYEQKRISELRKRIVRSLMYTPKQDSTVAAHAKTSAALGTTTEPSSDVSQDPLSPAAVPPSVSQSAPANDFALPETQVPTEPPGIDFLSDLLPVPVPKVRGVYKDDLATEEIDAIVREGVLEETVENRRSRFVRETLVAKSSQSPKNITSAEQQSGEGTIGEKNEHARTDVELRKNAEEIAELFAAGTQAMTVALPLFYNLTFNKFSRSTIESRMHALRSKHLLGLAPTSSTTALPNVNSPNLPSEPSPSPTSSPADISVTPIPSSPPHSPSSSPVPPKKLTQEEHESILRSIPSIGRPWKSRKGSIKSLFPRARMRMRTYLPYDALESPFSSPAPSPLSSPIYHSGDTSNVALFALAGSSSHTSPGDSASPRDGVVVDRDDGFGDACSEDESPALAASGTVSGSASPMPASGFIDAHTTQAPLRRQFVSKYRPPRIDPYVSPFYPAKDEKTTHRTAFLPSDKSVYISDPVYGIHFTDGATECPVSENGNGPVLPGERCRGDAIRENNKPISTVKGSTVSSKNDNEITVDVDTLFEMQERKRKGMLSYESLARDDLIPTASELHGIDEVAKTWTSRLASTVDAETMTSYAFDAPVLYLGKRHRPMIYAHGDVWDDTQHAISLNTDPDMKYLQSYSANVHQYMLDSAYARAEKEGRLHTLPVINAGFGRTLYVDPEALVQRPGYPTIGVSMAAAEGAPNYSDGNAYRAASWVRGDEHEHPVLQAASEVMQMASSQLPIKEHEELARHAHKVLIDTYKQAQVSK